MGNVLSEVVSFLQGEGIVSGEGIDVFIDCRPETPDQIISFYEYPGLGRLKGGIGAVRNVQVSVRSPKHDPSWAKDKAWEIFAVLCPPEQVLDTRENTVPGTFWGVVEARQTPFKINIDANDRTIYAFNIGLTTKED